MLKHKPYLTSIFCLFTLTSLAQGATHSTSIAQDRHDWVIQQQLDCVSRNLNHTDDISWANVCYTSSRVYSPSREQLAAANQQLDAFEASNEEDNADSNEQSEASDSSSVFETNSPRDNDWYDLDEKQKQSKESPITTKKHQFSISREMYYAKYEEPNFMHQEGTMGGFAGSYAYRPQEKDPFYYQHINMYRFQAQYATGKFDYSSNGTGIMNDKDNMTYEMKGTVGKDFYPSSTVRTTPYFGAGYRFLRDESEGRRTSTGHLGYDRESNYYFLPVGIDVLLQTSPAYSLEGNMEIDWVARGKQISKVGYISGYNDATNIQTNGYGLRGSLKLTRNFKYMSLFAEGFIRYWNMGQSEIAYIDSSTAVVEPKNNTEEIGLRLGLNL